MDDENIERALNRPSRLLAWFELNRRDLAAREYTYNQIPEHYTWQPRECRWQRRRQISKTIGQLAEVSPTDVELYHLRILLRHTKGATCYADLKTVAGELQNLFTQRAENYI